MGVTQKQRENFNRFPVPSSQAEQFGGGPGDIHSQQGCLVGIYDVAVDGGAVGTITPKEGFTIPDNAIITKAYFEIITAFASAGGAGTIALQLQSAGDLLAAVDADTLSGIVAGVPVGSAATMIKLTAQRSLAVVVAVEALTAGKARIFAEWVQSE